MPHVFSELVYGSLEIGGLFLPPPLVGVALLQLLLDPQQLGLVAFLHHTTQHRSVSVCVCVCVCVCVSVFVCVCSFNMYIVQASDND